MPVACIWGLSKRSGKSEERYKDYLGVEVNRSGETAASFRGSVFLGWLELGEHFAEWTVGFLGDS